MNWNAFEDAPAEKVEHAENLEKNCDSTFTVGSKIIMCVSKHEDPKSKHFGFMFGSVDETSGDEARVEWA